ncbi:MAG: alpha/beta fold hydrolase [Acidimicrobiales bacterium]
MTFVTSGSARLACTIDGTGPPVLLLHAGVTDSRSWAPLIDVLRPQHRTIAYDQRGYGRTSCSPEPHDPVDDALAVLAAAGAATLPVVVIGASNGGKVALDLALARPDLIRALVLIGSAVSGAPEDDLAGFPEPVRAVIAAYEAAEELGDPDELNRVEAHAWLDGWSAPEGRVGSPARDLFLEMNGAALRADPIGPERDGAPAWDRVGDIAAPTLVLCGDLDDLSLPLSEHLAARVPNARFERLAGTGHLPHLEAHPRCLEVIDGFLAADLP